MALPSTRSERFSSKGERDVDIHAGGEKGKLGKNNNDVGWVCVQIQTDRSATNTDTNCADICLPRHKR